MSKRFVTENIGRHFWSKSTGRWWALVGVRKDSLSFDDGQRWLPLVRKDADKEFGKMLPLNRCLACKGTGRRPTP